MNTYSQPIPPSEPFSLHGRQSSQTRPRRPLHMRENEAPSSIPPILVAESAIPNNTAVATVPVNATNTTHHNDAINDRQMGFSTEDSILLDKFSKNVITGFYIIEFVKFIFFFVIMMVTQVFDGSFNSCLIIFEVILGVYTILLIRHQFFCQTNQEKQINAYRIFQAILYILFVVFFQKSLAQDEGFEVQTSQNGQKINVPLIAITGVVLGNEVGKAIYIFSQSPRYKWRFAVRYNTLTLIRKLLLVAQVSAIVAVLITHTDELNQLTLSRSIWIYISIPLLLIGVTYAVQLFSLLRNYFTEAGKQLVSCLNPRNSLALLWITVLPIIWVGLIIWLVVDASDELPNYKVNAYDYYGDKHDPFLILFLVISVVSVVSVVITRSHQSYIMNIIRVLVTFYDTSLSGHQRMQAFLLELHKKEDARNFIPEFLIKISNDYFRLPTKPEIVLYEKIHKKKGILSRTKEEIQKEPAEIRLDADNEASEKDQEKAEKSIHYSLSDLEKNENQCVICFDNNPDAVYLPCGHGGACYECAQELARIKGECHLCRSPITRILKIAPIESLEDHVKVVLIMTTEKKETPNVAARRAVPTQIRLNVN